MKIHIFKIHESPTYFISDNAHITILSNSLNKYCPFKVEKIKSFTICSDFASFDINKDINMLNKSFYNLFNHFFGEFNTKSLWYNLNDEQYQKVITYLDTIKNDNKITKPKLVVTKSFRCSKCNKDFSSDNYLDKHLEKCVGLNCDICEKQFTKKHNFKTHSSNCGIFTCEKCSKIFNSRYKFLNHLNKC
jgi:hypothetical protein